MMQSLAIWREILLGALPLRISAQFLILFLITEDSSRVARDLLCAGISREEHVLVTTRPGLSPTHWRSVDV
jgi:hypothetical protein